jgi:GDP-4-dehydro-6-deoxy-D-mannose reductase
MRVLITGAAGFVGRYLIEHCLSCDDNILATDRSVDKYSNKTNLNWVNLDVSDYNKVNLVISDFKPEIVYHLAGMAFVPEAENNFDRALLVNVGGTNNIIRTCHLLQLGCTVLLVSSAEVYGKISDRELPITENTPLRPANNYSLSKLMAEQVAQRYQQFGYVRTIIARPFNHIGPGQDSRFVVSSFCEQLTKISKGQSAPIIKVGNLDARRDFSDVRDIVRAYRLAAISGQGVYNFGSGRAISIKSILDQLIKISGVNVTIEQDPTRMRPSEVPIVYGSFEKAYKELGWKPEISIEQTLQDTYKSVFEKY